MNKPIEINPGEMWGELEFIRSIPRPSHDKSCSRWGLWKCHACGREAEIRNAAVTGGKNYACGCRQRRGRERYDLTGQTFGRLTVIKRDGDRWSCRCSCGETAIVYGTHLKRGNTRSCGCLLVDMSTKHGLTGSDEYGIWQNIKARCLDEKNRAYGRYGGDGISVCSEWKDSFEAFYQHVGPRPSKHHSIDRIDGTKWYEPGNIRWATPEEQGNNKKSCRYYEHDGKRLTISQWARLVGLRPGTLKSRLDRAGMSFTDAISMPLHAKKRGAKAS